MGKALDRLSAKSAARASEQEPTVRELRKAEAELAHLRGQLATEKQKRVQAEQELVASEKRGLFLLQTSESERRTYEQRKKKPNGQATAIVVMNDWHSEETVDPETVNGLNAYNLEVAEKRIKEAFQRSVLLLESERSLSKIGDLVLAVLGDLITGYIHEELEENNSLSPTEACLFVQDHLCAGIDYLLKHANVKSITIPTAFGNHGRTSKKPKAATGYANSYEWLLYNQIERLYRNEPRVTWKIDKGYHNWLEIQGKWVRFHHGDAVKYQGGIGGITIPLNKAIAQWDKAKRADLDVLGHWHTSERNRKAVISNCIIGYSPYAERIKAEFSEPSQTFIVIDRDRPGAVTVKEIFC